jgi:fatty-acyl-CoA synthase
MGVGAATAGNFADTWEQWAQRSPDEPCQRQGSRLLSWADTSRRADALAAYLLAKGADQQAKIAQYLYNCPEYLESVWACFKAGLAPVNTNYRYADDELVYLWTNADVVAVVFHGCFAETIARIRPRLPGIGAWLCIDTEDGPCPAWADQYEEVVQSTTQTMPAPWGRSESDIYLLYTGGTTGLPKGVMWRQADVFEYFRSTTPSSEAAVQSRPVHLPACPLMHGTGFVTSLRALSNGGQVITLTSRSLDIVELLDTVAAQQVTSLAIVGDVFASPMLQALDENPDRWDISSLRSITSSGVMWSAAIKKGLLRHNPTMVLNDSLGSAEAMGMASSTASGADAAPTGHFQISQNTRVVSDDGRFVKPGSDEIGMVAVRGFMPVGYYKDAAKTAATFRVIGGERWSIPGDYASVAADGTLTFMGRGSTCINTGGEKVFPEEVEEVIKTHPAVRDALVLGLPDQRFGESIYAVVECEPRALLTEKDLIGYVKQTLARYKAPRKVLVVESLRRASNGKIDLQSWRQHVASHIAAGNNKPDEGRR